MNPTNARLTRCAACACSAVTRNPLSLRLVGLCPLLAVSQTIRQSFTCALLFALIVLGSGLVAAVLRDIVSWRLRPMYHTLLAASATSFVIAVAQTIDFAAVAALGIYPALIAGNCYVLSHIQEVAERQTLRRSFTLGCRDTAAITGFLVAFGALREFLSTGGVFGTAAATPDGPFPVFASAPGALLLFALVCAAANRLTDVGNARSREPDGAFKARSTRPITEQGAARP